MVVCWRWLCWIVIPSPSQRKHPSVRTKSVKRKNLVCRASSGAASNRRSSTDPAPKTSSAPYFASTGTAANTAGWKSASPSGWAVTVSFCLYLSLYRSSRSRGERPELFANLWQRRSCYEKVHSSALYKVNDLPACCHLLRWQGVNSSFFFWKSTVVTDIAITLA